MSVDDILLRACLPHARQKGLFLFIALARMVTFCKEGGGMLSVWALRACSYKTKAEAYQQGIALHPLQGVYLVFVLLQEIGSRSSRSSKVQKISVLSVQSVVVKEPILWRTALQAEDRV